MSDRFLKFMSDHAANKSEPEPAKAEKETAGKKDTPPYTNPPSADDGEIAHHY